MTNSGHLTVAWEMLSSVVMLRAKAREQKYLRLLSSLHNVEVELARIIAGSDAEPRSQVHAEREAFEAEHTVEVAGTRTAVKMSRTTKRPALVHSAPAKARSPRGREDQQLQTQARKYLANARQLREVMIRGEVAASRASFSEFEADAEQDSDLLLSEQQELALAIAGLKASSFEGLTDKAQVLDDLVEEGTDDPVQLLARSLAQDIIQMKDASQLAS
jgi:hypothetical protein